MNMKVCNLLVLFTVIEMGILLHKTKLRLMLLCLTKSIPKAVTAHGNMKTRSQYI